MVKDFLARVSVIAVLLLAILSCFTPTLGAQSQCTNTGTPSFILSAASGSPVPSTNTRSFTFPNDSESAHKGCGYQIRLPSNVRWQRVRKPIKRQQSQASWA